MSVTRILRERRSELSVGLSVKSDLTLTRFLKTRAPAEEALSKRPPGRGAWERRRALLTRGTLCVAHSVLRTLTQKRNQYLVKIRIVHMFLAILLTQLAHEDDRRLSIDPVAGARLFTKVFGAYGKRRYTILRAATFSGAPDCRLHF